MQLKNKQLQIPGGYRFVQPEVKSWRPRSFPSFDSLVNQVIALRKGNTALLAKGLSTDYNTVSNEVEQFNVLMCQRMGWSQYISGDTGVAPIPKPMAPAQSQGEVAAAAAKAKTIWAGVRTLNDWYESKEPAVSLELSSARAKTCSECPFNEPGDFTKWFTNVAAEAIKKQVEKFSERKLSTPHDDKLHTCRACLCVNKLSVHAPIQIKLNHMTRAVFNELKTAPACWVVSEANQLGWSPS